MALKKAVGKSQKNELEKDVHVAMIRHDVCQVDVAEFEDVSPQAINNRLKRLNRHRAQEFKNLIRRVASWKNERTPSKATG